MEELYKKLVGSIKILHECRSRIKKYQNLQIVHSKAREDKKLRETSRDYEVIG